MNQSEYAHYLANLVEDFEIDVESDLPDQFYAYFQCFMPSGKEVEKVFEPLKYSQELFKRLYPIYKATEIKTLALYDENLSPGYFCPEPSANDEEVIDYGKQHIRCLKEFAHFIEDKELLSLLNDVKDIELMDEEPEIKDTRLNIYLYDAISDWGIENSDNEDLISILDEAYYSIDCDYYLSYYFRYPVLVQKPKTDFLRPYYDIWKVGYYCKFDGKKLIIHK